MALALLPSSARAQSSAVADYVAFAQQELRWTKLSVAAGGLAAANGPLVSRNTLSAPSSDLVATKVTIAGSATCAKVFANDASGTSATCPLAAGSALPAFDADEIAALCTPPGGFTCASGAPPTVVAHDAVVALPPGAYGDVVVQGGAGGSGTLRLAGDYQFCSLRVLRRGQVVFDAPSNLVVAGSVTTSTGASILPAGVTPAQVRIQALGPLVRFSRGSHIGGRVCALSALAKATATDLSGQLVANIIRLKRSTLRLDTVPPTTTSTSTSSSTTTSTSTSSTTSTTSTTLPPECGNGIREAGEDCDGTDFGGLTCGDFSTGGAFLDGSASGGFLTCTTECTIDTSTCVTEICGNCLDDDGNGLTDFEDSACCAGDERYAQVLKKGRLRANKKKGGTRVNLKAILWSGSETADPTSEDVYVQARESSGDSLFCARLPASAFRQKKNGKRIYKFRDKRGILDGAGGLQKVSIRTDKHGMTRFKARGKHTVFTLPQAGPLEITVAFLPSDKASADAPRCSAAVRAFRSTKHSGLRFP